MFFIGLDLAWAAKNRTGIAVVDIAGRLQRIATAVSDEEIAQVIGEYIRGDCVVAIDAPLRVTNRRGPRPAERLLNREFHAFEAGARPAFTDQPGGLFDPPRGAVIAEKLDLDIDPESTADRRAIEVYPHPATVALFKLGCTLKYKRGRGTTADERRAYRKREMLRLIEHVESLSTASLALHVSMHQGWMTLRQDVANAHRSFQLDVSEDQIDAVLCAYVAAMFVNRREEIAIYGDFPANGYIATPKLPTPLMPTCRDRADDVLPETSTPITDLGSELDHCRALMLALEDTWVQVEDRLNTFDPTQDFAPGTAGSFRRAAKALGSADHDVRELLKVLDPDGS
jgi:predicted RNase H-like nuclease